MSKTRQTRTNQVMRHRNVVLELRCDLTLEEQRLKGVQLAEQEHQIAELENKMKLSNEITKKQVKDITTALSKNTQEIRQGWELRQVKCQMTYDYPRATVVTVRIDSGEVVDERAMNQDERQTTFYVEDDIQEASSHESVSLPH